MTLQEQLENAGSTIKYFEISDTSIQFLCTADNYEQFKTLLEIVEVDVVNEGYNTISGVSYSNELYKGAIKK